KKNQRGINTQGKVPGLKQTPIEFTVEPPQDNQQPPGCHEGRAMRAPRRHGRHPQKFPKNHRGSELDPRWPNRVSKLSAKGWKNLVAKDKDKIKQHRHDIQVLVGETGLEIGEFRKIVHMVQKGERAARQATKARVEANLRLV